MNNFCKTRRSTIVNCQYSNFNEQWRNLKIHSRANKRICNGEANERNVQCTKKICTCAKLTKNSHYAVTWSIEIIIAWRGRRLRFTKYNTHFGIVECECRRIYVKVWTSIDKIQNAFEICRLHFELAFEVRTITTTSAIL